MLRFASIGTRDITPIHKHIHVLHQHASQQLVMQNRE